MKISKVSFSGYKELHTVTNRPDILVCKALDNARPYLRQIGNSMPYPRDLVISVKDDGMDTILSAYDVNSKNQKAKLVTQQTEHTITKHGLDLVQKVFNGLEKNSPKEFKEIASTFVKRLFLIQQEQHPIIFHKPDSNSDFFDPHPACC